MAATVVTLNDLEGHSPVAGLLKCICAAFYMILTDNVLARFLCVSRAYFTLGWNYVIVNAFVTAKLCIIAWSYILDTISVIN